MSSGSVSESCCVTLCGCEEWLTAFCDYVTITLDSCGETTVFDRARFSGIKMSAVNPQSGVHPADGIFRVSMLEHSVEIALNSVITDSTGKEWVVYAIEDLASFCVKKIWARSVEACFLLLDPIEIFVLECRECDDCEDPNEYRRVGRVKGKVLAEAGSLSNRNDSTDLVYRFSGELVRWPLKDRPSARHRLKTKQGSFRITGVRDAGPLLPYYLTLEQEDAECAVQRQS